MVRSMWCDLSNWVDVTRKSPLGKTHIGMDRSDVWLGHAQSLWRERIFQSEAWDAYAAVLKQVLTDRWPGGNQPKNKLAILTRKALNQQLGNACANAEGEAGASPSVGWFSSTSLFLCSTLRHLDAEVRTDRQRSFLPASGLRRQGAVS